MMKPNTHQLRFPVCLLDTVLDKETEYDGTLPEYCPDVIRLIRVDCTPYVDSCEVDSDASGDKLHINGRIVYEVLYETDRRNKLRFCSFTQEFHHAVDLPKNDLEALAGECRADCCKITCKMLSPRRLVLHARLELRVCVTGERAVPALSTQPCNGMFFKEKTITFDAPNETVTQDFRFEEQLPLLQGEKSIGEVIVSNVTLQPPQYTVTEGCLTAKTNALVKVLYESEDAENGYCMTSKNIPLTVSLEDSAVGEGKICTLTLECTEHTVSPELDQYGENRLFKVCFTVKAHASLVGTQEETVAEDLFSADCEDTLARTELQQQHLCDTVDRSFTVDLKLPADEPYFTALYDTMVRAGRIRTSPADGGMELQGTLTISILGEGTDGIQHRDYTEEFVQFVPADIPKDPCNIQADVLPFEVLPTLHADGSISARVICNAHLAIYTKETVSFLSDVTKQVELEKDADACTAAYFFPLRTDDLWSIAKQYRVDPMSIRAANPNAFDDSGRLASGVKSVMILFA